MDRLAVKGIIDNMQNSFSAFMHGIIDYAGLFPPARLPLNRAVEEYIRHKKGPEAWMLNRFIWPVQKLSELFAYREKIQRDLQSIRLTILLRDADTRQDFLENLEKDLKLLKEVTDKTKTETVADVFEVPLSKNMFNTFDEGSVFDLLREIHQIMIKFGFEKNRLFVELRRNVVQTNELPAFFEGIKRFRKSIRPETGLKVRCGGEVASAFPEPEEVAVYIHSCAIFGIPFKATAGLHHPVRHFNEPLRTKMHGFINVFGAVLLAFHHQLDPATIREILEEESAGNFSFTDNCFRWRDLEIQTKDIHNLRNSMVIGFGSCSFDEPRDDLRTLEYL
jgi:hypothetical protein